MDELQERDLRPDSALVLGYGTVGQASVHALEEELIDRSRIHVVDPDPVCRRIAAAEGHPVSEALPRGLKQRFGLVLGCAGRTSFRPSDRHLLQDEALLVSGSSASVEFGRENFVYAADEQHDDEFELLGDRADLFGDIHADLTFGFEGGNRFTLLNAGFPINFTGKLAHLPTEAIEPTHCLLHAAAHDVLHDPRPGLREIADAHDEWLFPRSVARL